MNRHPKQSKQPERVLRCFMWLRLAMGRRLSWMNQAGGQRVFKKLDPERFPLCGEGVLPPVLFFSRSELVAVPVRQQD